MSYSYRSRDPFARETLIGREVNAGKATCAWCGSVRKGGKLIEFRVERDSGRDHVIPRLWCSLADMRSFSR
jgi:hypothetical protein